MARDDMAEAAPPRTRAEELRDNYYSAHSGRWRLPAGGYPVDGREALLAQLDEEEDRRDEAKADFERKAVARDKAVKEWQDASSNFTTLNDRVDVIKMKLGETLGLPQ